MAEWLATQLPAIVQEAIVQKSGSHTRAAPPRPRKRAPGRTIGSEAGRVGSAD